MSLRIAKAVAKRLAQDAPEWGWRKEKPPGSDTMSADRFPSLQAAVTALSEGLGAGGIRLSTNAGMNSTTVVTLYCSDRTVLQRLASQFPDGQLGLRQPYPPAGSWQLKFRVQTNEDEHPPESLARLTRYLTRKFGPGNYTIGRQWTTPSGYRKVNVVGDGQDWRFMEYRDQWRNDVQ